MKTINLGGRLIGDGQPIFFIAEAGVNHNGSVELGTKLVDIAAESGADAVKFQKRTVAGHPDHRDARAALPDPDLARRHLRRAPPEAGAADGDWQVLSDRCQKQNIVLLASGWDARSVDFLDELGVLAYKTASADLTNLPLLEHTARKGKPMFMSTGMATMDEVAEALAVVRKHIDDQVVLLQCTSLYPCDNDKLNLRVMQTYRQNFDVLVGYSGHERGLAPTEAAAALGACLIERHFTVDRTMVGPDHAASLEPEGLRRLIRNVRNIEKALGDGQKQILPEELSVRERLAKSVVAACEIPAGTVITAEMLTTKGPGSGLAPRHIGDLCGVVAESTIEHDTLVPLEALGWRRAEPAVAGRAQG